MSSKTALRNSHQDVDDSYANYITRDGPNMLANLANLANLTIFVHYIPRDESNMLVDLTILALFMQFTSPKMSLTCWRI